MILYDVCWEYIRVCDIYLYLLIFVSFLCVYICDSVSQNVNDDVQTPLIWGERSTGANLIYWISVTIPHNFSISSLIENISSF